MQCQTEMTLFKASDGDCILLRCIDGSSSYNILVDAGRASTIPKLKKFLFLLPKDQQKIDLFVVTHIDADHIAGAITLAKDPLLSKLVDEVWFNGAEHLEQEGSIRLSPDQGDAFSELIESNGWSQNKARNGRAIVRKTRANQIVLNEDGRVSAHLLGPTSDGLAALAKIWPPWLPPPTTALEKGGSIREKPTSADQSRARDTGQTKRT